MDKMPEQFEFPWQHSFPPFFTLQPHSETRARQISVWRALILDYFRFAKTCTLDIREASHHPLFNNASINRKLDNEFILAALSDLQRTQNAAPVDKQRHRWEIYWHTLEEWGNLIYNYVTNRGATGSVLTLFELTQGEDVQDEEFCGLETDVLVKALRVLEGEGKCEVITSDDLEGVKFF
ncbi:hypothetical protein PPYR_14417 [Photinus pyralis]|uniref:Vacuolar protein-sorting-associated protein 25 n=1 Tax=Photinus pyralis TaxID=7054 RepID=A0A1Y1LT65_PHOPY|nr:vacuolar protein-sorting-associated protein 25 [Photinus pyralis]KAB0792458.1 hypothetical protein PPYR_14417 [Photinus pyralis]